MKFTKIIRMSIIIFIIMSIHSVLGCSDAQIASSNLSTAADNFEVNRRVVFYNGITDKYILCIEGRSSVDFFQNKFVVTVKTGPKEFKKHYLGRADNVFPFVEQLDALSVDDYHYRVRFKPQAIIPDIKIDIDKGE